jgi:hypothetical protein
MKEFGWIREWVLQIRLALLGNGAPLVPLREYFELSKTLIAEVIEQRWGTPLDIHPFMPWARVHTGFGRN